MPAGVSGFFIDIKSFRSHYSPGVDSASNRNEYQEYLLGVKAEPVGKADNLPTSCAVVMKSGKLNFLEPLGPAQDSFTFYLVHVLVEQRPSSGYQHKISE